MKKGFTLIEMLVVVAIIGILAALLMPGLRQSLEQARQIVCMNNLKQIGMAHQMFIGDNNGELAPAEWADEGDWGGLWANWAGFLADPGYIAPPRRYHDAPNVPGKEDSVLRCPNGLVDEYSVRGHTYNSENNLRPYKSALPNPKEYRKRGEPSVIDVWYGNNGNNCVKANMPTWRVGPDDAKKDGRRDYSNRPRIRYIKKPSTMVSTFDGPHPTFHVTPYGNELSLRHGKRDIANVLFWDGHAISAQMWELPIPDIITFWSANNLNQVSSRIKWVRDQ